MPLQSQRRDKLKNTVQIKELSENDAFEHIQISDGMIASLEEDSAPGKSDYTDFILKLKGSKNHEGTPLARRKQGLLTLSRQVSLGNSRSHQKESTVSLRDESHLHQKEGLTPVPSSSGQRESDSKTRGRPRIQDFGSVVVKGKRRLSLDKQKMGINFMKKPRSAMTEGENTSAKATVTAESENTAQSKSTTLMVTTVTQVEKTTSLAKDDPTPITGDNSKGCYSANAERENGTSKRNRTRKRVNSPKEAKSESKKVFGSNMKRIMVKAMVHSPQNVWAAAHEEDQQNTSPLAAQDKNVCGTVTDSAQEESKSNGLTSSQGFSASTSSSIRASSHGQCIRESYRKDGPNFKDDIEFSLKEKEQFSINHENSVCSDSLFKMDQAPDARDNNSPTCSTKSYNTDLDTPPIKGAKLEQGESNIKERTLATVKKSKSRQKLTTGKNPKTGKEASSKLQRPAEGLKRIISKFLKNKTAKKNAKYKSGETFTVCGLKAVGVGSSSRFALQPELENSELPENTVRSKFCGEKQAVAVAGASSEVKKGSVIISPPSNLVTFSSMNSILLSNVVHDGIRELVGKGHSHIYVLVEPPEKPAFKKALSSEKVAFRVDTRSCPFELIPVKTPKASVTQLSVNRGESCNAVEECVLPGWGNNLEQVPLPSLSSKLTSKSLATHESKHRPPSVEANIETSLSSSGNEKTISKQSETSSCILSVSEAPHDIGNQNIPVKPLECSRLVCESLSRNEGSLCNSTIQTSVSEPKSAHVVKFPKKPGGCTSLSQESVTTSCLTSSPVVSTNEVVPTVSSVIASSTVHKVKNYTADALEDQGNQSQKKSPDESNQTLTAPSIDTSIQSQKVPSMDTSIQSQKVPSIGTSSQLQISPSLDSSSRSQKVCAFKTSNKSWTIPSLDTSNSAESVSSPDTKKQTGKSLVLVGTSNRPQTVTSLDRSSKTETDSLVDIGDKLQQKFRCSQTKTIPSLDINDQSHTVASSDKSHAIVSMDTSDKSHTVASMDTSGKAHTVASMDTSGKAHTVASMDTSDKSHTVASMDTSDKSHTVASLDTSDKSHTVASMDTSGKAHTVASMDTSDESHTVASMDTSDKSHTVASMDTSDKAHTVVSMDTSDTVSLSNKRNQNFLGGAVDNSANGTPKAAFPPVSQHACSAKSAVTSKSSSVHSGKEVKTAHRKSFVALSQAKESNDCSPVVNPSTSVLCKKINVDEKQSGLTSKSYPQAILPQNMIFLDSTRFPVDANTRTFVFPANSKPFSMLTPVGNSNTSRNAFASMSMKTIFPPWQPQGLRTLLPKPAETSCEKVQHDTGPELSQSAPETVMNKSTPGAVLNRLFKRSAVMKPGSKSPQGWKTAAARKSSVFKRSSSKKSVAKSPRNRPIAPYSKLDVLDLLNSSSSCGSAQIASSPALSTGSQGGDVKRHDVEEISIRGNPADCNTRRRNSQHDSSKRQGMEDGGEDSVTSTDSDSFDASLAQWTCSDVARYLSHHGLDKLIPGFQGVDGLCMVEMVRWYITSSDVLSKYLYDLGCNLQENLKMCSLLTSLRGRTSLDQPASTPASSTDN